MLGTVLSTLYLLSLRILFTDLHGKLYCYPDFADEETETLEGEHVAKLESALSLANALVINHSTYTIIIIIYTV